MFVYELSISNATIVKFYIYSWPVKTIMLKLELEYYARDSLYFGNNIVVVPK